MSVLVPVLVSVTLYPSCSPVTTISISSPGAVSAGSGAAGGVLSPSASGVVASGWVGVCGMVGGGTGV